MSRAGQQDNPQDKVFSSTTASPALQGQQGPQPRVTQCPRRDPIPRRPEPGRPPQHSRACPRPWLTLRGPEDAERGRSYLITEMSSPEGSLLLPTVPRYLPTASPAAILRPLKHGADTRAGAPQPIIGEDGGVSSNRKRGGRGRRHQGGVRRRGAFWEL